MANILVVDDIPANLTLLCGILSEHGYRVRPAPSGELALRAAIAEPPDLILLDISMPDMNGFEVCARVKADPRLRAIPVIFLTAHTEVADKVKAFSVGGVDYVTKPFQAEEVRARVATHLQLCRQQRELRKSYDRLVALERMRDGLVHTLVHDLRSPLASIIAFTQMLRERAASLPEGAMADLDECLGSARRMIGMVTAVLDVNKLEQLAMTVHRGRCDLAAISRRVVTEMRSLARDKQVVVDASSAEIPLDADAALLTRVVQNLLANALDFTPPSGSVRIDVGSDGGTVRFAITDEGPGVEDEIKARIFEKFGAVGNHAGRYSAGLGLTFCRMAVEAHGGAIGVNDNAGGSGTVFWFTLPTAPAPHAVT
jgi:two-component system, sensor histidine kinase and response regulator